MLQFANDFNMLSNYVKLLPPDVIERYEQKIEVVGVDPFQLLYEKNLKVKWESVEGVEAATQIPPVQDIDIYHYFVETVSFYTKKQLKCYKALDSYNFFISNHVKEVKWVIKSDYFIIAGKVSINSMNNI